MADASLSLTLKGHREQLAGVCSVLGEGNGDKPAGDSAWCARDFGQLRIPGVDVRDTDKCSEGVAASLKKLQNLHTPHCAGLVSLDSGSWVQYCF